jgi:nitrogen fixation/metabolism regulation signal transduction histidine kinase
MKTKAFVSIKNVAAVIAALVLSVAAATVLTLYGLYTYAAIAFAAAAWTVYRLITIYTKSVRKAVFMFDAVDNDDYTFSFSEDISLADDASYNEVLNRMKEILQNAKRNVAEREKYYELIMNRVRTGIVTLSDSGSVYQVNGEALRIFGLPVFTHVNQMRLIDPAITDAMKDLEPGEKRQLTFHNERGEVAVSLTASAVTVQEKPLKIIAVSDINNELAEKELESWMRLIRILTHEIMNSLAPITSLSDTLISMTRNRESNIAQGLATINATSKSLISFVESYRKFANIPVPDKTLFSLRSLMERAIVLQGADRGVDISLSVEPEDTLLYADEDQIGQVVINLIKNAVQAVADKSDPSVVISSRIDESENIIVDISNNGGAIPAEIAENIFMPFFTTKKGGSGIGLSLSRQIMRLHGGSLRLTSNTDSRVTFTLMF